MHIVQQQLNRSCFQSLYLIMAAEYKRPTYIGQIQYKGQFGIDMAIASYANLSVPIMAEALDVLRNKQSKEWSLDCSDPCLLQVAAESLNNNEEQDVYFLSLAHYFFPLPTSIAASRCLLFWQNQRCKANEL